ncbi:MAG: prenyltransferase [Methanomassiliicoccales archaeon PtaB.Bin134]|nr:MAG: prenyltransferase [Methanomassiliicoccales archaeon PtaB.Bin134]
MTSETSLLRYILKLSRFRFWIYTGGPFVVGYALGAPELEAFFALDYYVYLLYFFLPANIFIYGVNDYWDEDTDKLNKKKDDRELRVTDRDKRRLIWILWATVGVSAVLMVFQDNVERILFLIFLSLSYFYSAKPLRFKAVPILDFSSNMLYIMPGIFAYYLAGGQVPPLLLVLAGYFHIAAMHLFSAVRDKKAGIRTTAVVLGERRSLMLVAAFWTVFSALVIYLTGLHPLSVLVLMFPAFPLALLIDRRKDINKLYWRLPYVNNLLGGLLFSVVVLGLAFQS